MTEIQRDEFGLVAETAGGVRCGNVDRHGRERDGAARVYHSSAAAVRACYESWARYKAEMTAEAEEAEACARAEAGYERWLETRFDDVIAAEEQLEQRMMGY